MSTRKRRVLFVAENVTLAQVVRLATLAAALDPDRYEVHFACSEFAELVFAGARFEAWPIRTIERERVDRALRSGRRIYDRAILSQYVEEETSLLRTVRPDLVVGDFRQSLAISAPLAGVPLATLINAYWSSHRRPRDYPLPEHPLVRWLGVALARPFFPWALPWVFSHFARPVNQLRVMHGQSAIGSLPEVLQFGDFTLHPDVPSLAGPGPFAPSHRFLGPIPWTPPGALPGWWNDLQPGRPSIYVTLGSSGDVGVLPVVLEGLSGLGVDVLLATAARDVPHLGAPNLRLSAFLPGEMAARRSLLVISNGGSTTGYQAISQGTPVLGIPNNLDQYLASDAIARAGASLTLRSGTLTAASVRAAVAVLVADGGYRDRAGVLAEEFARYDSQQRFREFVDEVT